MVIPVRRFIGLPIVILFVSFSPGLIALGVIIYKLQVRLYNMILGWPLLARLLAAGYTAPRRVGRSEYMPAYRDIVP